MEKKVLFDEKHILFCSELRLPEELERKVREIEEAKRLLIIAAADRLEPNDERVLKPLMDLTMLQDDLKDLKAKIEKLKTN